MTVEEDLAIIRLRDKLVAEAKQAGSGSNLHFRMKLMQRLSAKQANEKEAEPRQSGRPDGIDRVEFKKTLQYWEDLHKATEPNTVWKQQEDTYNVTKDSRARPPPPKQATLWY